MHMAVSMSEICFHNEQAWITSHLAGRRDLQVVIIDRNVHLLYNNDDN
jgi:hypothetical protein